MAAFDDDVTGELSTTMHKYLVEVFRLAALGETDAKGFIGTSALADALDVTAPAVNRMVKNLKDAGLLEHEPYRGIRLTEAGRRTALKELRRQRIVEVFLVQCMGFKWHEIHAEADRITWGLSDQITNRMIEMSGHPTHCPHGEPIPSPEGTMLELDDILLSDAPSHILLTITRVRTRESDRLEYLAALGLLPGTRLEIWHKAPFNGPIQLKVGSEYRIVGHNLAELIKVQSTPE